MLFIGVGNDHRRDDGAGLAVARSLRLIASPEITVVEHAGDLTALLDLWESRACVYVADAMRSGDPPGTVHRYEWPSVTLPAAAFRSMTHEVGLREVLELGRALGRLPARLVLFGIVGANFDHGEGLSPAVAATVGRVARRLGSGLEMQHFKT
jgi:hydrogenase maturation protease